MARTDVRHAIDCPARASIAQPAPVSEPIARVQSYVSDRPYSKGNRVMEVVFLKDVPDDTLLYAEPPQAVVAQPVDAAPIAQSSLSSAGGVPTDDDLEAFAEANMLTLEEAADQWRAPAASIAPLPVVTAGGDTGNAEADRIIKRLESSDPDVDDCVNAVAFIRRLVAEHKGPDGFSTWKDAAIHERVLRAARIGDEADAQRYRKLKRCGAIVDWTHTGPWKFDEDIDAAIDAAIDAQQPEQGEGE